MKRDKDLVRHLLLQIEEEVEGGSTCMFDTIQDGYSPADVRGHHKYLVDAGLVDGSVAPNSLQTKGLLPAGYDLRDEIRDPDIWRKTKEASQAAGGWSLSLLSEIARGFLKTKVEKHTGVEL